MITFRSASRILAISTLSLLLYGCGTPQSVDQNTATSGPQTVDVNALLSQAQTSQSPQKEQLLLQAAEALNARGDVPWARNLLNSLDNSQLSAEDFAHYSILFSGIALDDDAYFLAQRILTNPRLQQQWLLLTTEQQRVILERRAQVFQILGETNNSIEQRLALQELLGDSQLALDNQEALWQTLMAMHPDELQQRLQQAQQSNHELLQGWYSLALISKSNPADLEQQLQQVNRWIAQWPQHPASFHLPQDLQLLQQLVAERPKQVALLLPQQGRLSKAGAAVRDGFMAAYFSAQQQGASVPQVRFYDSAEGDIGSLYQQAINQGAELVIGPLDKNKVNQLTLLFERPIPILAVNYSDDDAINIPNLYQFGLSTEDEAKQIAQRAWVEGHRYALLLTADAGWATRSADSFKTAWEAQGGTVLDQSTYTGQGDFSKVIKSALHIDESEQRSKLIRSLVGNIEFEPRRRQDADMLFLVARPDAARQIKPTLAFHYASDLPVLASSLMYNGQDNPKRDRDLNGIRFSTLPWFFDEQNPIRDHILQSAKPSGSYERLYALGADTFQLYPRLKQLQVSPYMRLHGLTGGLSMNAMGHIEREQVWAKMHNGEVEILPNIVNEDSVN